MIVSLCILVDIQLNLLQLTFQQKIAFGRTRGSPNICGRSKKLKPSLEYEFSKYSRDKNVCR